MHSMYPSVVPNYSPLIVECGRYRLCHVGGVNDGMCGWDHCRGAAYLVNVVSDRVGDDYFYDGAFVAAAVGRLPWYIYMSVTINLQLYVLCHNVCVGPLSDQNPYKKWIYQEN